MRGLVRSLLIAVLVIGVTLGLWKVSGGDVGGFFDAVGAVLYTIIDSVSNFFANLFAAFFG